MTQKSDGYTVYTGTKVAKVGGPQFLCFDQKLLLPSSFFHFLSKKVWRRCVDKPKVCGFRPGQLTSWLVWWLLFALYICHLSIKMLLDLLRIRTQATSLPGIRELPGAGAHHGGCQPAVPWLKDLRPKISEYPNIIKHTTQTIQVILTLSISQYRFQNIMVFPARWGWNLSLVFKTFNASGRRFTFGTSCWMCTFSSAPG